METSSQSLKNIDILIYSYATDGFFELTKTFVESYLMFNDMNLWIDTRGFSDQQIDDVVSLIPKDKDIVTLRNKEILNHGLRKEREELIDHRVFGRELNLFSVDEETGIGLILWHPKGSLIRKIIRNFWEEQHLNSRY